jgi:NAD(P)-dependent dehydrogenase (short-subunit alcohol dehydrogenase family)
MKYTAWLNKHIADLSGQTILVTGANSGLGLYASMQLAYRGAHVVLACRDRSKGEAAQALILKEVPTAKLTVMDYDQSSFSTIDHFVHDVKQQQLHIDVLLLNAGIIFPKKDLLTKEGMPLTTGVNFFNVYYLLRQLIGFLDQKQKRVKVVFVGSFSSHKASLKSVEELLNPKRPLMEQYAKSKLALAMLAHHFHVNLNMYDFPVLDRTHSILVHPGLASTNIVRFLPAWGQRLVNGFISVFSHSGVMGALSLTYACGAPYLMNGSYVGPGGPFQASGFPKVLEKKKHFSVGSAKLIHSVGRYIKKVLG